jgi:hypothetical protein
MADDNYRLMIARQGVQQNMPTEHNIVICLDLSGSMSGAPFASLKKNVPIFLQALYNQLPSSQTLNIKIIGFDSDLLHTHSLVFNRASPCPDLNFMRKWSIGAMTNLNIIANSIGESGVNMCVAFTDGVHNEGKLDLSQLDTIKQSKNFAKLFLCPVGTEASSEYFKMISSIFGGNVCPKSSVTEFCNYVASQANDLLTPQYAYSLGQQLAKVFWVPVAK